MEEAYVNKLPAVTGQFLEFYYIDGSFTGQSQTVVGTITDVKGKQHSTEPYHFLVYKPSANFNGVPDGAPESSVGWTFVYGHPFYGLHLGLDLNLQTGNSGQAGYSWVGTASAPNVAGLDSSGHIDLVQLVNNYTILTYPDAADLGVFYQTTTHGFVLDNTLPYTQGASQPIDPNTPVNITLQMKISSQWADSPANDINTPDPSGEIPSICHREFHAEDYLTYKDAADPSSIRVTLQYLAWDWVATTVRQGNAPNSGWSAIPGGPAAAAFVNSDSLPVWLGNAKNESAGFVSTSDGPPLYG